jgi:hypothetical protein
LQTTRNTRYFLLFTSHAPRFLRLSHAHPAGFSHFYFNHARPERLTHADAVSTIGRNHHAAADIHCVADSIYHFDDYPHTEPNADVDSASAHARS